MTEGPHPSALRARIAELEAQNARYQRLLEQAGAPAELRHRLRNTLSTLRLMVRGSATPRRGLPDYVAHLEDRIQAIIRAQATADAEGGVDLHGAIADELLAYRLSEGDSIRLAGPTIILTPRAGQLLTLALHELTVNAIEHGSMGANEGELVVSWQVAGEGQDRALELRWTEKRPGAVDQEVNAPGFGTEVIKEMLPYQLDAVTTLEILPAQVTSSIRLPLTDAIGTIAPGMS